MCAFRLRDKSRYEETHVYVYLSLFRFINGVYGAKPHNSKN